MISQNIERSHAEVIINTLPKQHLGKWFQIHELMNLAIKPPYDNQKYMVGIEPILSIVDSETKAELYRFQTATTFQFDGKISKESALQLVYNLMNVAINDFNILLLKNESTLTIHKEYSRQSFEEMKPQIEEAFKINHLSKVDIKPYWRKSKSDFEKNPSNDELIYKLPPIPEFKKFYSAKTAEQQALDKLILGDSNEKEEQVIRSAIAFYHTCFSHLQKINLFVLSDIQANYLIGYLRQVFNINVVMSDTVEFNLLERVTTVKADFLENGKIRDIKFLKNPPRELNVRSGVYGRANSPKTTVFYASFYEHVAIREVKPGKNERIVISTWQNTFLLPFLYFPICLAPGIDNEGVDKATKGLENLRQTAHPLLAELVDCFFTFLGYEFIKDMQTTNPKKYEYLFSSYFADRILQVPDDNNTRFNFDAIIYPSVAWNHQHENIAIKEASVGKLQLISAKEVEVLEVFYDRPMGLNESPIKGKVIRQSKQIIDGRIFWDDD